MGRRVDREMGRTTVDDPERFVESLQQENDRLRRLLYGQRMRIAEAERESSDPVSELRDRVDLLSEENYLLRAALDELEHKIQLLEHDRQDVDEEVVAVQSQNHRLLCLYLAAHRLHGSLNADKVLRAVVELVVNFVGSECFELCAYDLANDQLVVLTSVGTGLQRGTRLSVPSLARTALAEGYALTASGPAGADGELRACIPLMLDNRVLGAILIRELVSHKAAFDPIDHELFDLIGAHAGTALCLSHVANAAGLTAGDRSWSPMLLDMVHRPVAKTQENPP